jgi:hypothetical protein
VYAPDIEDWWIHLTLPIGIAPSTGQQLGFTGWVYLVYYDAYLDEFTAYFTLDTTQEGEVCRLGMFASVSWDLVRANSSTLSPNAPDGIQRAPNPQQ